uniref:Inter-alpha-trypsin inhibitor heavy chain family member 6 n=1 Tax=Erpetoichthys calabaricus TaxID=27687 RepID=A0A8C4TK52_ERPCA
MAYFAQGFHYRSYVDYIKGFWVSLHLCFLCFCCCMHLNFPLEIVSRYAITTVECSMWNPHSQAKEAIFEVELPGAAFISNFTITINNKVYVAEVKERATAKRIYEEAKKKGRTAGHVGTKETEKFRLAINVEAESQMTFTLTYEELLQRRLGHYEVVLSVRPGQLVSNLTLELSISERTGISFLKVLPLRTTKLLSNTVRGDANIPPSTEVQQTTSCAHIRFTPTLKDQKIYSTSTGIAGDFVVQYDVDLKDLIGDVQVIYNGYFVHYFAPRGLPIIPKNVIFLIDVSGSMIGTKIKQTKNAMQTILSDLRPDDHFNIITFSDVVNIWNPNSTIQATPQNVKKAKDFVSKIVADGTDINAALMMAGSIIKTNTPEERSGKHRIPLVILLTDGEPTIGVTSGEKIAQNTKKALNSTSLFGLAFGDDADFPLLRRLSMENRGVARRIYEDADAALQLSGFYDEVASPLLYDIQLNYLDNHVYDVTQSLFPNYFQGSELVVAGRVQQDVKNLHVTMTGSGLDKNIALANDVAIVNPSNASFGCSGELERIPNFVHRLWAYFTIKELLRVKKQSNMNLALKTPGFPFPKSHFTNKTDSPINLACFHTAVFTNTHLLMYCLRNCIIHAGFFYGFSLLLENMFSFFFLLTADGDPHFLVHLPKSGQNICFTINGQENDELRLVDDPIKGVSVTGHLKAVHSRVESQDVTPTYFDRITIITETHGAGAWTITITLHNITLNGEASALLRTDKPGTLQRCDLNITVDGALRIWVKVAQNVEFLVLLHHYQHPINHQMDHLGIYISQGGGLSLQAHGLLGKKDTILYQLIF